MTNLTKVSKSFPTLRRLIAPIRWILASRKRFAEFCLGLLGLIMIPVVWWSVQLWGLPDVGDPFDVAAFSAEAIPDDQNAFVLYRQAITAYQPVRGDDLPDNYNLGRDPQWKSAPPAVQQWLASNQFTLDLVRQGANRPDALDPARGTSTEYSEFDCYLHFQQLILLEASRAELTGDMAGAWNWYRTSYRMIRQISHRAATYRRADAQNWLRILIRRVALWASDNRTTPEQVRAAINDVEAVSSLPALDDWTLKTDYAEMVTHHREWDEFEPNYYPPWLRTVQSNLIHGVGLSLSREQSEGLAQAMRLGRREPERCRRLARLSFANRLAFLALPPDQRPLPDPASLPHNLYELGPSAPPAARVLNPSEIGRWLDSSPHGRTLTFFIDQSTRVSSEPVDRSRLLVVLGSALYRRDHGLEPASTDDLVGPYLKSLPDGSR